MDDTFDSAEDENNDDEESGQFMPSEQRESVKSTRRSDEDRRQSEKSFEGEEKRETPDRREKSVRNALGLNITCKTSGSITNIEDWLDDNCQSGWKVVLDRIDKDMVNKHLTVVFETESDKDTFLDKYLKIDE